MYRQLFPQYDPIFLEAVSSAVAACNLDFTLRKEQMQALYEYTRGRDVVVNLQTGFGKSLCYSLCPLICDSLRGVTSKELRSILVLISPLKALMDDQIFALEQYGLSCIKLTQNVSKEEILQINCGDVQVLVLSPESFECVVVLRLLQAVKDRIHCVAIDEAHCIEQWGRDFRSAYENLGQVRSLLLPKLPLMALTATITKASLAHIVNNLNMEGFSLVKGSNNRKNIFYSVQPIKKYQDNDFEKMELAFVKCFKPVIDNLKENGKSADKCIIFCFSHNDCCEVYEYFERNLGESIFHQGNKHERLVDIYVKITSESRKKLILELFRDKSGYMRLVIASVAFGMGVNCPDVRKVIHFRAPASLTSYVQESGRGGRDGNVSNAILFYSAKEFGVRKAKFSKSTNHNELNELEAMETYCHNTELCRRFLLLKHFDGDVKAQEECLTIVPKHKCCDICLLSCKCDECTIESPSLQAMVDPHQIKIVTRLDTLSIDCDGKKKLKEALESYKESLCQEVLLVRSDLSTGFSDEVIEQILTVCDQVNSTEDIMALVDVWDTKQANIVLSLIQKVRDEF